MSRIDAQTQEDFRRARQQALLTGLLDLVRRRSNDLLSFDEVRVRLNVRGQRYLGHQTIAVNLIVGSEGRYSDFDRHFLPRHDTTKGRWRSIDKAHYQAAVLPPVELYKISDVYFVKDGNHRVSVARQRGQLDLDAYVTELLVDVPLTTATSTHDLLLKEEYSDFLEWTNLHQLRPDERIEFSEMGGYLELVRHINAHRYYLGQNMSRDVERDEAVMSWYDSVYTPIVQVICEQQVLLGFPERTEADVYRWVMDHRWYLHEQIGSDPGPQAATLDYLATYGRKGLAASFEEMLAGLSSMIPWPGQHA